MRRDSNVIPANLRGNDINTGFEPLQIYKENSFLVLFSSSQFFICCIFSEIKFNFHREWSTTMVLLLTNSKWKSNKIYVQIFFR